MPNFSSAGALSAAQTNTVPAASSAVALEAAISSLPAKIQQLARQIEISGTLAEPPSGASVTLNTSVGQVALLVTQLVQAQQGKLLQQLIAAYQSQRPLTVVMQPGNPPEQAILVLPNATTATASVQNTSAIANQVQPASVSAPPLPVNVPLTAVVLPNNDIEVPMLTQAEFQAQMPVALQTPAATPNTAIAANLSETPIEETLDPEITAQTLAAATVKVAEILADMEQPLPSAPLLLQDIAAAPQTSSAIPAPATVTTAPPSSTAVPTSANTQTPQAAPGYGPHAPEAVTPAVANPASPAPASAPTSLLQPGTEISVSVAAVIDPPAPGQAVSPPVLQPNQVLGTVIGNAPNGQIIVKTDGATLFIRQPASAPIGSQLVLTVDPGRNAAPTLFTLQDPSQLATLPQVIAALAQADPAMLQQIMATRIPQPGQMLPTTLLLFLSAVREGDVSGWLGNGAADLLTRAGKAELVGRLMQELQSSGQSARDDIVGEWRSYAVPILDNHQLAYLYFHVHNERRNPDGSRQKTNNQPGSQQMRFVIDMRMSRLGPMQLDGFLRPKKLDIVMRSERKLPLWLDNELRQTYTRTLGAIGYSGALTFQSGRGNWVNVQKSAAGRAVVT